MAVNSKEKGDRGEREFAAKLEEVGIAARRSQQYQGVPVEGAADLQTDLDGQVRFEVKRYKQYLSTDSKKFEDWLNQLEEETPPGEVGILAYRANRRRWELIRRVRGTVVRVPFNRSSLMFIRSL